MSTNNGGSDGFGGSSAPVMTPRDGDEILDDPTYSDGPEFFPELPAAEVDGGDQQGGGAEGSWLDTLDDETRELAEKKGWSSAADLARGYREIESAMGRRSQESDRVARLEQELAQMRQQSQAPAPQGQSTEEVMEGLFAPIDYDNLEQVAQGDPKTMMAIYHEQVMMPRFRQGLATLASELVQQVDGSVGQRLAPVEDFVGRTSLRDSAAALMRDFPQEFPKYRAEITERMMADPSLRSAPDGMRRVFSDLYLRDQAAERRRAAMQSEGEAALGGRGPARQGGGKRIDVDEEIRRGMEQAGGHSIGDGL